MKRSPRITTIDDDSLKKKLGEGLSIEGWWSLALGKDHLNDLNRILPQAVMV